MDKKLILTVCCPTGAGQINFLELRRAGIPHLLNKPRCRSIWKHSFLWKNNCCVWDSARFCLIQRHAVGPLGKTIWVSTKYPLDITLTQTLPSHKPSLHLKKHTSYSHPSFSSQLVQGIHADLFPATSAMSSGWASNNVISVAITERRMWFITWINSSRGHRVCPYIYELQCWSPTGRSSPLKVFAVS